jgi:hypothetical protein
MALDLITQGNRLHQGTIDEEQIAKAFDVNPIISKVNSISATDNTLTVNTISEKTATGGVTIDGVLLKDGGIQNALGVSYRVPFISTAIPEAISGPGAIGTSQYYTAVTSTGADAFTFGPGGGWLGALKKIELVVDGGDATVTVTGGYNVASFVMDTAGDYVLMIYSTAGWVLLENHGCTVTGI